MPPRDQAVVTRESGVGSLNVNDHNRRLGLCSSRSDILVLALNEISVTEYTGIVTVTQKDTDKRNERKRKEKQRYEVTPTN